MKGGKIKEGETRGNPSNGTPELNTAAPLTLDSKGNGGTSGLGSGGGNPSDCTPNFGALAEVAEAIGHLMSQWCVAGGEKFYFRKMRRF
jgi:hypothetical protein